MRPMGAHPAGGGRLAGSSMRFFGSSMLGAGRRAPSGVVISPTPMPWTLGANDGPPKLFSQRSGIVVKGVGSVSEENTILRVQCRLPNPASAFWTAPILNATPDVPVGRAPGTWQLPITKHSPRGFV